MEMVNETRTEEQIAADNNLTDAITKCLQAYSDGDYDFVLSDYAILMTASRINDDNEVETSYPTLLRDGDLPWYKVIGLIEMHRALAKAHMIMGNDNG